MHSAIRFYFDFSSPYSYIASEWVDALGARHGRPVEWHAVLLGATFATTGLRPPVDFPLKREYSLRDFQRSARYEGLPYVQPQRFPLATQLAARVFWWLGAEDPARAVAWAHAVFRAYFARGVEIDDAAQLKVLANETGIDATAAEAAWGDPTWKLLLKSENDAAIAAGVFGAPFFIVDAEPFWGNDRRAQIERFLSSQGRYQETRL